MIPIGLCFLISSSFELQGRTTEKTFCSRTRRAISCEYCAPKSSTTIEGVSTNEFLREFPPSKEWLFVKPGGEFTLPVAPELGSRTLREPPSAQGSARPR